MFPVFILANSIRNLVNNLSGVTILNPVSLFFLFRVFNFILSAIIFSGSNFDSSLPSSAGIGGD